MINEKQMTLGTDWAGENPKGWFMSEKLDGCRAYWDGRQLWTRGGNIITAPETITRSLPSIPLDGEIWAGRGQFEIAKAAVQYNRWSPGISFVAFDAPMFRGDWGHRIALARETGVRTIDWRRCDGEDDLMRAFDIVKTLGGEGLMIRNPKVTRYETGRTKNLLKVKEYGDAYFRSLTR